MMTSEPMKKRALIVDDEIINRIVLKAHLEKIGYEVVEAEDGAQAVAVFKTEDPDIVFMDIVMPGMDGYQATREIKRAAGDHFIPIIILTAMDDEGTFEKCIDVGGDDVLSKPYDETVLRSKVRALSRIQGLYGEVQKLYNDIQHEEQIAEEVFNNVVVAHNVALDTIQTLWRPAGRFSGDTLLTAYGPGGDLHVLLGDFTGHGLAAALGAIPTAEVFRAMVTKGFSGHDILIQINDKLCTVLPANLFLAACYINIRPSLDHITVFNCAMPDLLIVDHSSRRIKKRVSSQHCPLGLVNEFPGYREFSQIDIHEGDELICFSDGLIESRNEQGQEFDWHYIDRAIHQAAVDDTSILNSLSRALQAFCGDIPQHDDISLVTIPCNRALLLADSSSDRSAPSDLSEKQINETDQADAINRGEEKTDGAALNLTMCGERLKKMDPVPLLINQLQEIESKIDTQEVFTILSELYVNAFDHGVLKLDSALKEEENGFERYFTERDRRIAELNGGRVAITIDVNLAHQHSGRMVIKVEDSGQGFAYASADTSMDGRAGLSGRGIPLLDELCESLCYEGSGNRVVATYTWPR
ncbi:MAG: fused response regulator/phosphatase [Gammaproteobacteria bacterium]|nr:fused response regulator/phosphatase [Gammaproteobacteria bacterium]